MVMGTSYGTESKRFLESVFEDGRILLPWDEKRGKGEWRWMPLFIVRMIISTFAHV